LGSFGKSVPTPERLGNDLSPSVKKLAAGALRVAVTSQLGPLAGGLFLAGGAIAARVLAEGEWAKTSAELLMELASDKAGELFGSAFEGFRGGHNSDIETSMRKAAIEALARLRKGAPTGFGDWFDDWHNYLSLSPPSEVFAGVRDLDPVAFTRDDAEFRDVWWEQMEPVLAAWHNANAPGLHINDRLPGPLAAYLRQHMLIALEEAHREVLRDPQLNRSWIAFQQDVSSETLKLLWSIKPKVDRIPSIETKVDRMKEQLDRVLDRVHEAPIWTIPLPTRNFQDRPDLIEQIDRALEKGATALTALHGLGGIGKTQLARAFAQQRRDRYKLGVWIEAETQVSLLTSLSTLAPLLGVPAEQDQQAMAVRVMNEISARAPWIAVFDNAASVEELRPYVEMLSGEGDVLITSRNEHRDGLAEPVSVTTWSPVESTRFLLERTKQGDRDAAEKLARDLDGLVLALEHAAAYMRAGDGMALAEYRRVWREKLKWVAKGHAYPGSVAAALELALEAVAKDCPAAYDLLCIFSWLAPDRIPRAELLEAGASELPELLKAAFADHDQWAELIATLSRYSLLGRERAEGVVTGYFMHRVVQEVVRDRLKANEAGAQWLAVACSLVNAAFRFDPQEPNFWAASEALLPHARSLREHVRGASSPPASVGRLLNEASIYLRVRGLYVEARDFRELVLESDLRHLGPDHPNVAVYRSNLADSLRDLGEHAEARKQIELALESALRQFGPDHPTVAVRRSKLGITLWDLGEHAGARKQIELALESDLGQFGPDHPNVAVYRSNLATILRALGELEEARKQIELALESDLRQFGPDHPNVAVHRSNLANILRDLGEHAEARKQIELALESDLRQFGPDHPTVAVDRSNLATILGDLGEHAEARKQIELALESDLRQLGPDHSNVAVRHWNLAAILYSMNEYEGALREIDLALEIFRRKLPPGHPHTRNAEAWALSFLPVWASDQPLRHQLL
jgi:tetratricopeptide (TPR) repeat protein